MSESPVAAVDRQISVQSVEESEFTANCRICWRTCAKEELMRPCSCDGSQAYVHFECLAHWIEHRDTNNDTCDVCLAKYAGIEIMKTQKGFGQWIAEGEDVIGTIIATTLVFLFLFYILMTGTIQFIVTFDHIHNAVRYLHLTLTVIFSLLFSLFLIASLILCCGQYKVWSRDHYTITVLRTDSDCDQGDEKLSVASTESDSSPSMSSRNSQSEPNPQGEKELIVNMSTSSRHYGSTC